MKAVAAGCVVWVLAFASARQAANAAPQVIRAPAHAPGVLPTGQFLTSHECLACHNGLTAPDGEDVSIGVAWRASMMANSSRDPYWQAAVRREIIDHPSASHEIEDDCSVCHAPMSRTVAKAAGQLGQIFAHLAPGAAPSAQDRLAADGVSCTICHQIGPDRLGTKEGFSGGFVVSPAARTGERTMFGPFEVDAGRAALMRSATGMTPAAGPHIRESEMCATCHTLYTRALGPKGEIVGELPEQVPYLEWRHSAFVAEKRSCQACHMPEVTAPTRVSSVLGDERPGLSRHTFLGGNFFMLRMLNRYRTELGVEALPHELEAAARATAAQLQRETAMVSVAAAAGAPGRVAFDVLVRNLTGHKLPTGYPSRRAWLHVTVRDGEGRAVFTSGAIEPSGLIRGNDNDSDASRAEPHHTEITSGDQVQIYESVMQDVNGRITTGLLRATAYVKDNRLLPRGFDKATAARDIAVIGGAQGDADFTADGDRVRYVVDVSGRTGPFRIDAELLYQPIAFRWARNLDAYKATETRRFVNWFDAMSAASSIVLARAGTSMP